MQNCCIIKHQAYHQNRDKGVFKNDRIQTSINYGQDSYQMNTGAYLKLFAAPSKNVKYRQKTQHLITQPSWISPLLQQNIKQRMKTMVDDQNILDDTQNETPMTDQLRRKARKIHNETLKYNFVKDWERIQQQNSFQRKNRQQTQQRSVCNPKSQLQERWSPNSQNEVSILNLTEHLDLNVIPKPPLQKRYPSQQPFKEVISTTLNLSPDDSRNAQQYNPNLSNVAFLMKRKVLDKSETHSYQVKYLNRNNRTEILKSSNENPRKSINSLTHQMEDRVRGHKSCHIQINKTVTQPTKLQPIVTSKLRQSECDMLTNPYIIFKSQFHLQNLKQKQWQNNNQ